MEEEGAGDIRYLRVRIGRCIEETNGVYENGGKRENDRER